MKFGIRFWGAALMSVLGLAMGAGAQSPLAVVWDEPDAEALSGLKPVGVVEALEGAGYAVQRVGVDWFESDALAKTLPVVVVLPYGGLYPAASGERLDGFLRQGGSLMCLGGVPLMVPVLEAGGELLGIDGGTSERVEVPLAPVWTQGHASAGVEFRMEVSDGGTEARVSVDGFSGYGYLGTVPPATGFEDAVLCFDVRAVSETPRLCAEITARDGSRWKYIVPMSGNSTEQRIHLADFVSYNSPKRSEAGDYCRPGEVRTLAFGFTSAMVGSGERSFDLRNVRFEEAVVGGARVRSMRRFARPGCSVKRWFGDPVAGENTLAGLSLAEAGGEKAGETLRAGDASLPFVGVEAAGRWRGTALRPAPVIVSGSSPLETALAEVSGAPFLPLLALDDETIVGALAPSGEGPYAGSCRVFFTIETSDLAEVPLLRDAFVYAADAIRDGMVFGRLKPVFGILDGQAVMTPAFEMRNFSRVPRDAAVTATLTSQGTVRELGTRAAVLPASKEETVTVGWDAISLDAFDWQSFSLDLEIQGIPEGSFFGERRFTLNTREALKTVCDFLLGQFNEHGRLHGNRFIDNRGMRTLLAGYEIFGERAYRDGAMRWAEEVVMADQREDGGYRMGYGIGSKGESCYVADGGEIAVCIARLVSYAEGGQREALLKSLDGYMAYRESFRVAEGGIGVGWCLHDYGQRPVVPLDKPTRIYSPERNTYTIGCTLAAAYAHARLRRDRSLEERAEKDAEWLMPRTEALHGAFIESFMYAHAFTTDPEQRGRYAAYIREAFRDRMLTPANRGWWLRGGGRSALNLDGFTYWLDAIEPDDAEMRAGMAEAVCSMFSQESEHSLLRLLESSSLGHDAWIYICYGGLGLADVVKPMVSIEGMVPEEGAGRTP